MDVRAVGQRVGKLRIGLGLSQTTLAQRAGLHRNTVSNLERGIGETSIATLESLAKHLGVTLAQLLGQRTSTPKHAG